MRISCLQRTHRYHRDARVEQSVFVGRRRRRRTRRRLLHCRAIVSLAIASV